MKYLIPSEEAQTISIIPRVYTSNVYLTLRNDSTDIITTITPSDVVVTNNYLELTSTYQVKEGHFYDLKVYEDSKIIYRDKVFCTGQTINQLDNDYYSVNNGANDFIEI